MKAKYIVSDCDRGLLEYNGFDSFESLWDVKLDWFEEPNYRRNGWSGVSQLALKRPDGSSVAVFVKRQQNHNFKSLLHPMRGLPTIYREYRNLCRLKKYGIPCPDLVFYGHRNAGGQWQAILITRSLMGYKPLDDCMNSIEQGDVGAEGHCSLRSLRRSAKSTPAIFGMAACTPNIFLSAFGTWIAPITTGPARFDSIVIDLERMRIHFPLFQLALRDLDQLYRRWKRKEGDWEAFIDSYLACIECGSLGRKIRETIIRRSVTDWAKFSQSGSAGPSGRRLVRSGLHAILKSGGQSLKRA